MLSASAAVTNITPPVGGMMDGYGGRAQGSQGVHDPLMARAVVLDYGPEGACVIVSCDLLALHAEVIARARERVTAETGIRGDAVLIAATHNHAGPAGLRGGMFAQLDDALAEAFVDRVSAAIAEAHAARRPAVLTLGAATIDTVSMNRRHPDWPSDHSLRVLLVDGEDGVPIASILNFACHATVMKGDNLLLSGEFPGAACRLLLEQTGAPAVYLNGACGNVNPTWIAQDFESVQRVGQIIGGQALRTIGELRTIGPGQRAHNIRWDEFPEKPVPGRLVEPHLRVARREIDLPLRSFEPDDRYASGIADLESRLGLLAEGSDERRAAMADLSRVSTERWAALWARRQPEKASQRTEIQVLSLGEGLAVLALPGEFFVETADVIRAAADTADVFIACYANDYLGYIIPADAYEQGGYESGITFCPPETEAIIVAASLELLKEVG